MDRQCCRIDLLCEDNTLSITLLTRRQHDKEPLIRRTKASAAQTRPSLIHNYDSLHRLYDLHHEHYNQL